MEAITDLKDVEKLERNAVIGKFGRFNNSVVSFTGSNNILVCNDSALEGSKISFKGNNSLVYLGSGNSPYRLAIDLWNESTVSIGNDCYFNGIMHVIASEQQNVLIGNDGLFSFGNWIRTADPHLIYSCESGKRLNNSKSVYIGDHVWIGQDALLLKGSMLGSGSIVAARSVVANKIIPSNTCWGGNPVKQISEGVFFLKDSVHAYSPKTSERSQYSESKEFCYRGNGGGIDLFDSVDQMLFDAASSEERLSIILSHFYDHSEHDRFAIRLENVTMPSRRSSSIPGRVLHYFKK